MFKYLNIYTHIIDIYTHKILRSRQRRNSGHSATSIQTFQLKTVMIKNTILVCFASASTLCNWIGWWTIAAPNGGGATLLYFDIFINMTLVALMFRYNETYYKKLCSCCIKKCFKDCDRAYNQKNEDKIRYQLELYFKNADLNKVTDRPYHSSSPARKNPKLFIGQHSIYLSKVDSNSVANSKTSINYSSDDIIKSPSNKSTSTEFISHQITPAPTPKAEQEDIVTSMKFPPLNSSTDKSNTPTSINTIDKKTK